MIDLAVGISNGVTFALPGTEVTYSVVVSNHGSADAANVFVSVTLPGDLLAPTWTCSASPGSSCAPVGSGPIADSGVTVREHGTIAYTISGTIAPLASGALTASASASASAPAQDTSPLNNSATDVDYVGDNDVPTANAQAVGTLEDQPVAVTLMAQDTDGDPLTWSIESGPAHGTLSGVAPSLTYIPAENFNGSDAFTFRVNDAFAQSNVATVTVSVAPVNDAPVAVPQAITLDQDSSASITLTGTDVDGDTLMFAVVASPAHGTLSASGASLVYTPAPGYRGSDALSFRALDGQSTSSVATVALTVNSVNSAPFVVAAISDQSVTTQATSITVGIAAAFSDADIPSGDVLSFSIVGNSNPSLATPSISGGTLTIGLAPGVSGTTMLAVRATDSRGLSAEDSFQLVVVRPALSVSIGDRA